MTLTATDAPAVQRPAGAVEYAGFATRTIAFAVDAAIINAVAWFVAIVAALGLSLLHPPDWLKVALAAIGAFLAVMWTVAYFAFFWSATGQTPGNRAMRIRVLMARSGAPPRGPRAVLRVLALVLSALPLCAGFLLILVDGRRRALHDRVVRTVVVYVPPDDGAGRPRPRTAAGDVAFDLELREGYRT